MNTPDATTTVVNAVVAIRPRSRTGTFQTIDGTSKADNPPATKAPRRLFLPSVSTPRGTRRAFSRVISWILDGKIDPSRAYAIGAMLTGINKSLEIEANVALEATVERVGKEKNAQQRQSSGSWDSNGAATDEGVEP